MRFCEGSFFEKWYELCVKYGRYYSNDANLFYCE